MLDGIEIHSPRRVQVILGIVLRQRGLALGNAGSHEPGADAFEKAVLARRTPHHADVDRDNALIGLPFRDELCGAAQPGC